MAETARLQKHYREVVKPKLRSELGLASDMQVPRITKITVNMGVGEAVADKKVMDAATGDLAKITGQKPSVRKSKKSIASFKIRDGLAVGCMRELLRSWQRNVTAPASDDRQTAPRRGRFAL